MSKQILNGLVERFVSKKLLCLLVGLGMELSNIGISDNLLYLMISYIGGQAIVDSFLAYKNKKIA